jgi:hypothetical protein
LEERDFCSLKEANANKSFPITADNTCIVDWLQLFAAILARHSPDSPLLGDERISYLRTAMAIEMAKRYGPFFWLLFCCKTSWQAELE